MQMPLTVDYTAAKLYISNASPEAVQIQGTVINDALLLGQQRLQQQGKKYKTILLITDGEDHDKEAVNTAKKLAENGVIVHTIGVGTTTGGTIVNGPSGESKRDMQGNVIISKLNEKSSIDIAQPPAACTSS